MNAQLVKRQAILLAPALLLTAGLFGCGTHLDSAEDLGRKAGRSVDEAITQIEQAYDELGEPEDGPAEKLGEVVDDTMVALLDYIRDALHGSKPQKELRQSQKDGP